jgi:hypothetical protein
MKPFRQAALKRELPGVIAGKDHYPGHSRRSWFASVQLLGGPIIAVR